MSKRVSVLDKVQKLRSVFQIEVWWTVLMPKFRTVVFQSLKISAVASIYLVNRAQVQVIRSIGQKIWSRWRITIKTWEFPCTKFSIKTHWTRCLQEISCLKMANYSQIWIGWESGLTLIFPKIPVNLVRAKLVLPITSPTKPLTSDPFHCSQWLRFPPRRINFHQNLRVRQGSSSSTIVSLKSRS